MSFRKSNRSYEKACSTRARVLRDGKEAIIPAKGVVPGDIILIEAGDRIPADARLIKTVELKTEEAALTAESTKSTRILKLFSSFLVQREKPFRFTALKLNNVF